MKTNSQHPATNALVLLAALGAALLFSGGCKRKPAQQPPSPPTVQVITISGSDVPIIREWVASLDGTINATIHAQVSGYIMRQNYREGMMVKTGDILFEIDDRPIVAALAEAKAQLAQAEAKLGKTEMDVKRYTPLAANDAISQQELDDAIQSNLAAKGQLEGSKAAVLKAEIDLGFTKVRAPIDGLAGFAKVATGDLVGPGSAELTTISSIDPIRAYFSPSELEYLSYAERRRAEGIEDLSKDTGPELSLVLADGSSYPEKGKILFTDRQVDQRTGAIRLASSFPNTSGVLRPGMFARVRAIVETRKNAIVVPQRAVVELQGTYQVVVVGQDSTAAVRPVKLAGRTGSGWIVSEGLKPGEQVVVEGVQKARPGTPLKVTPYSPPAAKSAQPTPTT